jgi:hypothetical protein
MNSAYSVEPTDFDESFDLPTRFGQFIEQHPYKPLGVERGLAPSTSHAEAVTANTECQRVAQALRVPEWDFRTLDGIAGETGLARVTVEHWIAANDISRRPYGRPAAELFTAKERPVTWRERLSLWSSFVAKRPR